MIATTEAVDILRHGWHDAASTLAADVPEVAELLQARLEMAIASDDLSERHLLDTIQEVESVSSRSGSPSGPDLARRLRRTVYEYLLALDAARPLETAPTPVDQPARALDSPLVGAEEVAALGHASRSRQDPEDAVAEAADAGFESTSADPARDAADGSADVTAVGPEDAPDAPGAAGAPIARRRFALRRRQRHSLGNATDVGDPPEAEPEAVAAEAGPVDILDVDAAAPDWRFTPAAEPAIFDGALSEPAEGDDDARAEEENDSASVDPDAAPDAPPPLAAQTETFIPGAGAEQPADEPVQTFVAPRAGFHIVEDAPPHRVDREEPRLQMPAFTADVDADRDADRADVSAPEADATAAEHAADPAVLTEPPDLAVGEPSVTETAAEVATFTFAAAEEPAGGAGSGFLAWPQPDIADAPAHSAATPPPPALPPAHPMPPEPVPPAHELAAADATPPLSPHTAPASHASDPAPDEADDEPRGWGVRRPGEASSARRGASGLSAPQADDPFENNTRLAEMRRRIEERLRRKRCDEAAALLQEIAQETGGRAVAELAMNAGDRCRALGKSNAALNCYLAAARSDPVYELPLSRLADVCIDNQDTELAVSYLERIARIYRFREDDRAALRTYRRIATIAPYREDVLTLLMNAERTGQLQ